MSEYTQELVEELYSTATALPSEGEWVERDGDMLPDNVCTRAADELAKVKRQRDDLLAELKKWRNAPVGGYGQKIVGSGVYDTTDALIAEVEGSPKTSEEGQ